MTSQRLTQQRMYTTSMQPSWTDIILIAFARLVRHVGLTGSVGLVVLLVSATYGVSWMYLLQNKKQIRADDEPAKLQSAPAPMEVASAPPPPQIPSLPQSADSGSCHPSRNGGWGDPGPPVLTVIWGLASQAHNCSPQSLQDLQKHSLATCLFPLLTPFQNPVPGQRS